MALPGNKQSKEPSIVGERESVVERLSRARSLPAGFQEDRRSVYWENNLSQKDYSKTTSFVLNKRQEELVYSKRLHPQYVGSRPSPIWRISRATLSAPCSQRLRYLSVPKKPHPHYQPARQVRQPVSRHALSAQPSPRISSLAKHKTRLPLLIKPSSEWEWGEWQSEVTPSALNAAPTPRVTELAAPKRTSEDYKPCKRVQWIIPKAALMHTAGERLSKLSLPKVLTGYQEDYDPNTYKVSKAALLAQPSPCIENLAKPIPRKCRQKKNV